MPTIEPLVLVEKAALLCERKDASQVTLYQTTDGCPKLALGVRVTLPVGAIYALGSTARVPSGTWSPMIACPLRTTLPTGPLASLLEQLVHGVRLLHYLRTHTCHLEINRRCQCSSYI